MNFQQFQEELQKLRQRFPVPPNYSIQSENSDYGNYLYMCKDAYFCFETADSNNITYLFDSFKATHCVDGDYIIESGNCYDSVDTVSCNNCAYMNYCSRLYDSYFCWDCSDSHHLFGCVHLTHKEYCIFNKQFSPEEYEKKVAELMKRPIKENFAEMKKLSEQFPVTQTNVMYSENCDYNNQVFHSKNMYLCFDSAYSENCAYLYDAHRNKNCYDMTQSNNNVDCYEMRDSGYCNNCHHLSNCGSVYDSAFSEDCDNSNHLFGCSNLSQKEYCILNKQYSKEEYEKQVAEIMSSYRS